MIQEPLLNFYISPLEIKIKPIFFEIGFAVRTVLPEVDRIFERHNDIYSRFQLDRRGHVACQSRTSFPQAREMSVPFLIS